MYSSCPDKAAYTAYINHLKQQHMAELERAGRRRELRLFLHMLTAGKFVVAAKTVKNLLRGTGVLQGTCADTEEDLASLTAPDYFSDERIAVYTVITGPYDRLLEPACRPDNCDFYLISDTLVPPEGSAWKPLALPEPVRAKLESPLPDMSQRGGGAPLPEETGGTVSVSSAAMTALQKNRFLKMHPHLLFPDYPYSVYLDGNLRIITDPTEFVHRLPACGAAFHRHASRDCVYDEAEAILEQHKAPAEAMEELVCFLKKEKMPSHYGLLECPVIVRRHGQSECIELMEAWWEMFERFPYRDQMLLPYLLYQRGMRPRDLAFLGGNVRRSPAFRRYPHAERDRSETMGNSR